jgi:NAD(P)-dependent dehydrogenase (short-subunit alcohol dehydrogenase family)
MVARALAAATPGPQPPQEADFPPGCAVVFGGSGGIGAAICEELARRGVPLLLTYRASVTAVLQAARQAHGQVHTVVLATGSDISMTYVAAIDPDEWLRTVHADLTGALHAIAAALLRGVAREEGRFGIRANTVAPGVLDGGLFDRLAQQLDTNYLAAIRHNTALRRFGTLQEVARAVAFLASRDASCITGQRLVVDGGYAV